MKLAIAGTILSLLHLLPVVVVAQSQPLAVEQPGLIGQRSHRNPNLSTQAVRRHQLVFYRSNHQPLHLTFRKVTE